ncbi:lipopolysaccharide biosynthesis protein [Streptomyces sp. NPDC087903]|uniref:lipopolysaccharide biosynthesis protein n=1 Tax=Streptomyces sp. NPDC087903 TaxID=3365819 RepID=UPI0037FA4098
MAETRVHERAAVDADGGSATSGTGRGAGADSMFKNAYFLMLSTGVSAVLGLGFWLVAARYYSEEAVGQGSAAIAAMRLLASITATTMIGAVVRFVPRAGRATGSLVWRAYAASSVVVVVASVGFLFTLGWWGPSYAPLDTPTAGALFVAASVAWALLTLQDGVLTGLRKAEWVPAGNAVFSVGKLILLVVFATSVPVLGIFVSWAVAIAFSTLPLGWLIFRRLIPGQVAADRHLEPPRLREMGRFLAGDSLGALFSLAMINLLPVMVAVRFSAAENGFFYVAYTVGGTMEFMAINMASSLTAHASHDPRQLADGVRGALRRMTLLLVPVILVLVVFAPQILAPFNEDYSTHGSTVLRLLAIGALPRVAVELYIGVLRVQGRTGVLAVLQGTMCTLVLGSAAVLFAPTGIDGAGWAVVGSMTLMALVSIPGLRSALRGTGRASTDLTRSSAGPAYGTRWAQLNATAGYGTSWARRAAYEQQESSEDTVTLFIGHPGYEREALEADTLALIVRRPASEPTPAGAEEDPARPDSPGSSGFKGSPGSSESPGSSDSSGASGASDSSGAPRSPASPGAPSSQGSSALVRPGSPGSPDAPDAPGPPELAVPVRPEPPQAGGSVRPEPHRPRSPRPLSAPPRVSVAAPRDRLPRYTLWSLLVVAALFFWASLRHLPWSGGPSGTVVGGRELVESLPPVATAAVVLLLLVYVAAVTWCAPGDSWLPGSALGVFMLALYAAPVALGQEPRPVGGAWYARTAGSLANGLGLDGPGPLLRWAPSVLLVLCLVPLWWLLARGGGRLPWPGRWGALYLAAVGGWGWRQVLAPAALPLFVLLVLLVLFVLLALLLSRLRDTRAAELPHPAPDRTTGPETPQEQTRRPTERPTRKPLHGPDHGPVHRPVDGPVQRPVETPVQRPNDIGSGNGSKD